MSILISAPIRTGKTLYVIKCIFDELNNGRQVYTNIVGIKIDGVISVSSSIDEPFDWRNLPNGCVLVWDEAHEHPAFAEKDLLKNYELQNKCQFDEIIEKVRLDQTLNTTEKKTRIETVQQAYKKALERKKEEIRDIGAALLMHGHYGIEIYFITQRVTKLNTDVLASVTTHFVMRRKFGMDAAMIWEFGEAMTTWSKSTALIALNKKMWRYPKYLYKFYKSSENHQVRKSFPLKYLAFALLPLFLFFYSYSKASETSFFGLFGKKELQTTSQKNTTQANQQTIPAERKPPVCTYENIHLPDCQAKQEEINNIRNDQIQNTVYYKVNDPYLTLSPAVVTLQDSDFPRLSGCVKYNSKYYAIDQQGNKMRNISQAACARWIEDGERPFDYFKQKSEYKNQKTENALEVTKPIDNLSKYAQDTIQ